jgi:hypothetical protein
MTAKPQHIEVAKRLSQNLGLVQAGSVVTMDVVTPAGQKGKFRTTFVGYLPKQYVLIQCPDNIKLGTFANYIKQDTQLTVRGLIEGHEGAVVAFASKIKQIITAPSRLIVLDFPHSVGLQSLRNSMRIDANILVKININQEYWNASITDISLSGCQLTIHNCEQLILSIDKPVEIIIEDFQDAENMKFSASICNVKQQVTGVSIGVKFASISKETVIKLLHHIITFE